MGILILWFATCNLWREKILRYWPLNLQRDLYVIYFNFTELPIEIICMFHHLKILHLKHHILLARWLLQHVSYTASVKELGYENKKLRCYSWNILMDILQIVDSNILSAVYFRICRWFAIDKLFWWTHNNLTLNTFLHTR